jgi:hypothetical protein
MSRLRVTGSACVVLHSSFQRSSSGQSGACIVASEAEPLGITTSYELALELVDYHRKKMTSRKNTADYALCLWRDTIDGVDIIRTPRDGKTTMEVRLRIMGADIVDEKDQKELVRKDRRGLEEQCAPKTEQEPKSGQEPRPEDESNRGKQPTQGSDTFGTCSEKETVVQSPVEPMEEWGLRTPHAEGQPDGIPSTGLRFRSLSLGMINFDTEAPLHTELPLSKKVATVCLTCRASE